METRLTSGARATPEEAAKRINGSTTIAVVLPELWRLETIGSAAALVSGLRAIGKAVSVFAPPPGRQSPVAWDALAADGEPLREFIISFDLARSPIKELKYERVSNRLDIILSPSGRIRREDVEFRWGELRYDLVVTLGASSLEAAAGSIRRAPELLQEKPILNIDADPANQGYGDLNVIPGGAAAAATLPEIIDRILSTLGVPPDDPERATALFAALAAATGEFRPEQTGAGAFRLAGELKTRGADPVALRRLVAPPSNLAEMQLAGRAIARSRVESELGLLWAVVTAEDFLKTGTTPQAMDGVFERLRRTLPGTDRIALLWQEPSSATVRARLEEIAQGPASPAALAETFPSFPAAEEHIRRLLANDDAVE
ncbi:MAG: hypothetical protein Q8R35_03280 [bacterium]|nr:hypothetical protein [bacterium]